MLENPISRVYEQMQSLSPMKSFLAQMAVILQADAHQSDLLNRACFGRPILVGPQPTLSCSDGIGQCSSCQENVSRDINEEMLLYELALEEAFFLCFELKCLQVCCKRQQGDVVLNDADLWQLLLKQKQGFLYYYKAYSHLRRKNWIVRTGLQYGAHFIAYRHHPSQVHAEYAVIVVPEWEKPMQLSSWSHMQGIIRLCGTVAKTLLLLHVIRTELDDHHPPRCLDSYSIQEMEVKRWLPKKHRMDN